MPNSLKIISSSTAYTRNLGITIGRLLKGGEIICLRGDLGSGKTCLAQGIVVGTGFTGEKYPPSPTFSIVNRYEGSFTLFHLDLYRMESSDEIIEIGFEDMIDGRCALIIEWADKLGRLLPEERIEIGLTQTHPEIREIGIQFFGRLPKTNTFLYNGLMEKEKRLQGGGE